MELHDGGMYSYAMPEFMFCQYKKWMDVLLIYVSLRIGAVDHIAAWSSIPNEPN